MDKIDKIVYKSPTIKVVETAVNNVICSASNYGKVKNESFEEEEFEW